ncbi:MAG: helix-turn-helix domain-containing protein [Dongiaceae bacterium]
MARALDLSLRSYASQTLRHSHTHHQIVLPVAGVLEMEIAGKGGRVASCQAALIPAGEDHSCEAAGDNCFVVLDWTMDDAQDAESARLLDLAESRPFLAYDPGLQHLVSFLGCELRDRPAARGRGWGALLLSAMAARTAARPACPRQIARAIAYIHAHSDRRLGVAEIARAAYCSTSQLHALFQRHLATSPMDHVAEVRLERAMSLLAAGDDPISAIALRTGHADQSVLTRSMKRRRGLTPAECRRRAWAGRFGGTA